MGICLATGVFLLSTVLVPITNASTTLISSNSSTSSSTASIAVTKVVLNKSSTTLQVGDRETLGVHVSPSNATNRHVAFASSDSTVATVGNAGNITAIKAGNATLLQ